MSRNDSDLSYHGSWPGSLQCFPDPPAGFWVGTMKGGNIGKNGIGQRVVKVWFETMYVSCSKFHTLSISMKTLTIG